MRIWRHVLTALVALALVAPGALPLAAGIERTVICGLHGPIEVLFDKRRGQPVDPAEQPIPAPEPSAECKACAVCTPALPGAPTWSRALWHASPAGWIEEVEGSARPVHTTGLPGARAPPLAPATA